MRNLGVVIVAFLIIIIVLLVIIIIKHFQEHPPHNKNHDKTGTVHITNNNGVIDDIRRSHQRLMRRQSRPLSQTEQTVPKSIVQTPLQPRFSHHYLNQSRPQQDDSITNVDCYSDYDSESEPEPTNLGLTESCTMDSNCAANYLCLDGFCRHPNDPQECPQRTTDDGQQVEGLCSNGQFCASHGDDRRCFSVIGQPCSTTGDCLNGTCDKSQSVIFVRNDDSSWSQVLSTPGPVLKLTSHPVSLEEQSALAKLTTTQPEDDDVLWALIGGDVNDGVYHRVNSMWQRVLPREIVSTIPDPDNDNEQLWVTKTITDIDVTQEGQPLFVVHETIQSCSETMTSSYLATIVDGQLRELDVNFRIDDDLQVTNIYSLDVSTNNDLLVVADLSNGQQGVLFVMMANTTGFIRVSIPSVIDDRVVRAKFYSAKGKSNLQAGNISYVTSKSPGTLRFLGVASSVTFPQFTVINDDHPTTIVDFEAEPVTDHLKLKDQGSSQLHILQTDGYTNSFTSVINGVETSIPGRFDNTTVLHISASSRFYAVSTGVCSIN